MAENPKKPAFTVGQIIYSREKGDEIKEYVIERVGRKYIHTSEYWRSFEIDKETLLHIVKDYPQNNKRFYTDKQAVLDEIDKDRLERLVRRRVSSHTLTLSQLKQIAQVLGINEKAD